MFTLALTSEKGLWEELWEYFVDTYFSPDMPHLENIQVGTGSLVSLRLIIIGLTLGIIVASICTLYTKRYIGDFVRKMLYEECFDERSAMTLYDLGYMKSPGVRGVVKTGGSLSRLVRCVEEDQFLAAAAEERAAFEEAHKNDSKKPKYKPPQFRRDCNTMHFYIPEEKKYTADIRFDNKGANFGSVILICIGALLICMLLCYILPDMIKMVDNFISVMK